MGWIVSGKAVCMNRTVFTCLSVTFCVLCLSNDSILAAIISCDSREVPTLMGALQDEHRLWRKDIVISAIRCAAYCFRDIACTSFFYNKYSRFCQGHSITISHLENEITSIGTKLYHNCRATGYIGSTCLSESECEVNNALCIGSTCQCHENSSLSITHRTCVLDDDNDSSDDDSEDEDDVTDDDDDNDSNDDDSEDEDDVTDDDDTNNTNDEDDIAEEDDSDEKTELGITDEEDINQNSINVDTEDVDENNSANMTDSQEVIDGNSDTNEVTEIGL